LGTPIRKYIILLIVLSAVVLGCVSGIEREGGYGAYSQGGTAAGGDLPKPRGTAGNPVNSAGMHVGAGEIGSDAEGRRGLKSDILLREPDGAGGVEKSADGGGSGNASGSASSNPARGGASGASPRLPETAPPGLSAAAARQSGAEPYAAAGTGADSGSAQGIGSGSGPTSSLDSASGSGSGSAQRAVPELGAAADSSAAAANAYSAYQSALEAERAQADEIMNGDSLQSKLIRQMLLQPGAPLRQLMSATAAYAAVSPSMGIGADSVAGIWADALIGVNGVMRSDPDVSVGIREARARNKRSVYITVDDGPSQLTPKFLDIFEANGVRATFFVVGANVEIYPRALRETYAKGHYIANHSYSHKYSELYGSSKSFFAELERWDAVVSKALGFGYHTDIFRFPGGSTYSKAQKFLEPLKRKGYVFYDWNCVNGDAELADRSADSLYDYMVKTFTGNDDIVLLIHDLNTRQTTVDMLDRAIKFFKDRFYEFKTLDEKQL
jgi:peptidoglycan/xylan/chitin deacetylase (PgdA/CDA1 family)